MSNNRKSGRNELIIAWEEATNRIADEFIEKYYRGYNPDHGWVGDQIGGVLIVNDEFWDFRHILQATKIKPSKLKLFQWYDHIMDTYTPINLKSFLALRKRNR